MKDFLSEFIPALRHILPFAVFLILTGVAPYLPMGDIWMYPVKTIIVGLMLVIFWKSYPEAHPRESAGNPILSFLLVLVVGVVVFVVWIAPDLVGFKYPLLGETAEFNPHNHLSGSSLTIWIAFRLFGSSIVVPVMEELFWRSFLIRYIVKADFKAVPIGTFSWPSFLITVALFGVEHQRWLVGLLAGAIYNLLLYRTKSVFACIVAHAVTNFVLGIYVIQAGQWAYW